MTKALFCAVGFLALGIAAAAQDSSYYKAIQKGNSTQIQPNQFRQIERDALKDYSRPETYELLATSFENTTEKVWAVVYGEVFCNLSSDSDRTTRIGSFVFEWYDKSLSNKGDSLSVNLTENAEASQGQTPFESQFELSFLMGAAPLGGNLKPLSIQKLTGIRKNQLSLWAQKKLPLNELLRRQQAVMAAGHFEAYNYWLFQGARLDEFNQWLKQHQAQFQAWLDWQSKNKFTVQSPNLQRLHMIRGR
jgi:hypothetical protein